MSKRSSFRPVFPVVRGPIAIVGNAYLNTRSLPLREAKAMPPLGKGAWRNRLFRLWDAIHDCVLSIPSPSVPDIAAFFDLTILPEAASCRACSSNRQGSLDS